MKNHLYKILLISISCTLISSAQEPSEKKEILPAKLAIIAIGPKPPRRFSSLDEDKPNSAAALLPPRPGEIPPRRLHFAISEKKNSDGETKKDDKQPVYKSINVTFNNPSHFIEVPPKKTLKLQRRESSEYSNYISIDPLEPGSMTVVLLRPTGKGDKRWVSKPSQHKINLLDDALKNKKLAIVNLSRRSVKSNFHHDKKVIPAGGFHSYESIEGIEHHRIAAAYGQENRVIYNTALRLNKSNRLLIYVLYDANPNTNDGRTIGLFRTSMNPKEAKKTEQGEGVPAEDAESE